MSSARRIGLFFDSVSDNIGDQAIGLVLQRIFSESNIPFRIVDPFCPNPSDIAMLVIGGGELIRKPGEPFYDVFRVRGPHVLNSVGVLDGTDSEYLDEYRLVTVRSEADRARLGRGEVVPCLSLLYPYYCRQREDISGVPEGAIGIHLTADFRDEALPLARVLRQADLGPVVFIPVTHYQADEKILAVLAAVLPGSRVLPKLGPDEAFNVVRRLRLLISCSLHATLLAYAAGTPFLAYGGSPKIEAFLRERGLVDRAFRSASDIANKLTETTRAPVHIRTTFEQDRLRCRNLVDRILAAADTALATPPSRSVFSIAAANRSYHERDMAMARAAGSYAADWLEVRTEHARRVGELEALGGEIAHLQAQITHLQAELRELQTENTALWLAQHEILASTSWRATGPLRLMSRSLRRLGIDPGTIVSMLARLTPEWAKERPAIVSQRGVRSPEHMPLVASSPVDAGLKLIALCHHEIDFAEQRELQRRSMTATHQSFEQSQIDLRRHRAELAKRFGIHGFCFPYRPAEAGSFDQSPWSVSDNSLSTLRFCVWLGHWTSREPPNKTGKQRIAVGRTENGARDLQGLLQILHHPRYIRIHNKPLVLMASRSSGAEMLAKVRDLRRYCRQGGLDELHLLAVTTSGGDAVDVSGSGIDGVLELVTPLIPGAEPSKRVSGQGPRIDGSAPDYRSFVRRSYDLGSSTKEFIRSVLVDLDDGGGGAEAASVPHSSPAGYQEWLENVCTQTDRLFGAGERLVFIQGWNARHGDRFGWDKRHDYAYLNATAKALEFGRRPQKYVACKDRGHCPRLLS